MNVKVTNPSLDTNGRVLSPDPDVTGPGDSVIAVGNTSIIAVAFSLDISGAYASGDVLADTQVTGDIFRINDGTAWLQTIKLNDKDNQGIAMDIVILDANVALGAENGVVLITDANADSILHIIPVAAGDWTALVQCKVASLKNLALPVKSMAGAKTLAIGLITRGAPTHTANGITARLGFELN